MEASGLVKSKLNLFISKLQSDFKYHVLLCTMNYNTWEGFPYTTPNFAKLSQWNVTCMLHDITHVKLEGTCNLAQDTLVQMNIHTCRYTPKKCPDFLSTYRGYFCRYLLYSTIEAHNTCEVVFTRSEQLYIHNSPAVL